MSRYTIDGRLGRLLVRGNALTADIAEATSKATLDLTTSEVSQLELTIADPELRLLGSGLFQAGTPTTAGSPIDYEDLRFEVRKVAVDSGPTLKITARDLGAYKLKRAKGPHLRRDLSPTDAAALDARAVGLGFVGEPSPRRPTVARQADETAWSAEGRWAEELGYLRFVSAGVLYFARPTFLAEHGARLLLSWRGDHSGDPLIRDVPTVTRNGDDEGKVASFSVDLLGELGDRARPGMGVDLSGVPTFDGRYLLDRATVELDDVTPVAVSCSTAVNPEPRPPEPGDPAAPASSGTHGQGTAEAFLGYATDQAGDTYRYAAEASVDDPDPDAFDCSELVEWALGRAGVAFVDGSVNQINRCKAISVEEGIRTRGALLFRPGSPNHIAISLGNGRTIEARGRKYGVVQASAAGRFTRAGLVPGLRYG